MNALVTAFDIDIETTPSDAPFRGTVALELLYDERSGAISGDFEPERVEQRRGRLKEATTLGRLAVRRASRRRAW